MKYIIDFVNSATESEITDFISASGGTILRTLRGFEKIYVCEGDALPAQTSIVDHIISDTSHSITLHSDITIPVDDDNWWKITSWAGSEIADDATSISVPSNPDNMHVYVVDSGIDSSHSEFTGQSVTDLWTVSEGDYSDGANHGTAVASLITGNQCGMTTASIFNVKVFHGDGTITLSDLLNALDAIMEHTQANPTVPSVANFSWVIANNDYINSKIEQLIDAGVVCVASAGNQGVALADLTPASVSGVYTVGAYDQNFEPADFSNYSADSGPATGTVNSGRVDIWAPGTGIRIAGANNTLVTGQGTSFSAPIVTASIVYNMSFLEETFVVAFGIPFTVGAASRSANGFMDYARSGLLTLNPPYGSSTNKIASFVQYGNPGYNNFWTSRKGYSNTEAFINNSADLTVLRFIYWPEDVDTVTSVSGGISGVTITNGWLTGTLPELPEGEVLTSWTWEILITSKDGTQTPFVINYGLKTSNRADLDALDPDTLSEELQIFLQGSCADFEPIAGGCLNDCQFGAFCTQNAKTCLCA